MGMKGGFHGDEGVQWLRRSDIQQEQGRETGFGARGVAARAHLCFMGLRALYTVIHWVAGMPSRTFFFGWSSSASSSALTRPRFCPTCTPQGTAHAGSNTRRLPSAPPMHQVRP